jgi:hypothetical protein
LLKDTIALKGIFLKIGSVLGDAMLEKDATLLVDTLMILYFMDARLILIILIWIAKALYWETHKDD